MPSRWSIVLGLLGLTIVLGLLPPPGLVLQTPPSTDPDLFRDLEQRLMTAVQARDRLALKSLVADDYEVEGPDADSMRLRRGGFVRTASTAEAKAMCRIASFSREIDGPGQVTVRMDVEWTAVGAEAGGRRVAITDVWQAKEGAWKLQRRTARPSR